MLPHLSPAERSTRPKWGPASCSTAKARKVSVPELDESFSRRARREIGDWSRVSSSKEERKSLLSWAGRMLQLNLKYL